MSAAALVTRLLADSAGAGRYEDWTAILACARAESLGGSLAFPHRRAGPFPNR
jgi:hypothetical protein